VKDATSLPTCSTQLREALDSAVVVIDRKAGIGRTGTARLKPCPDTGIVDRVLRGSNPSSGPGV